MKFRVAMLNLEQDHKRWEARKPLITAEIAALKPDFIAFNEVSIPLQTAKSLQEAAAFSGTISCSKPALTGSPASKPRHCSPGSR